MNKPLLHQALDALLASRYYVEEVGDPEEIFPHMAAVRAIEAELAKPDPEPIAYIFQKFCSDSFGDGWEERIERKIPSYYTTHKIQPLYSAPTEPTSQTRNCSRHPDAPHGPDGAGCKCHSWAPGEAS